MTIPSTNGFLWRILLAVMLGVAAYVGFGLWWTNGAALGAPAPAPALRVTTAAFPSVLHPTIGKRGKYSLMIENVGAANSEGEITVKDDLPAGMSVGQLSIEPGGSCKVAGNEVSCTVSESLSPSGFAVISIYFEVSGSVGAGPLVNRVGVTGGGLPPVIDETSIRVGAEHEKGPAGIAHFGFEMTGPAGEPMAQAAGHPNFLTTSLVLNNIDAEALNEPFKPVEAPKDLVFYLPLGVLGNPTISALCPASLVETAPSETGCPPSSRIGTVLPMILSNVFAPTPDPTHEYGIYNVAPEKGYAAEFAFASLGYTFVSYASVVRRNGTYMLRISTPGVPAIAQLTGLIATFYGDIKEHYVAGFEEVTFDRGSFLTGPSDCGESAGARSASVALNTWVNPDPSLPIESSAPAFPAVEGCERLRFGAGLDVVPETTLADEPSGYEVGLEVPQAPNDASGLGTPPVKSVELKLPTGTTIAPGSANGLVGCDEVGPHGLNIEGPESEAVGADGLEHLIAGHCPFASQIGAITASTPLLREGLTGHLFIATPHCGGVGQPACTEEDAADGQLFGVFLEMEAPNAGVIIKLKGSALVDPVTGRITTVFRDAPQFPFSKLTVALKRGPRAPLANPQVCGMASSEGVVEPWSEPTTPAATPTSTFSVDWNGTGGGCLAIAPFTPSFVAGTTSPSAGAFSPFSLSLKREDREANVGSLSTVLPEGLVADLTKVGRCGEPQASLPSLSACPANSLVGSVTVGVGSGSEPYGVTGKVFFTGPYGGAPFGLSIVVPAVAGPFNLGDVLVRVALFVDPHTAQVTAVSGAFPQVLDGVPLRLRTVSVTTDAHEFTLNPTSCAQLSITGVVHSTSGTSVGVASPFAAAGCKNLAFKPMLSGSTDARSTKANGTSVRIKVSYPPGSFGGQAGLAKLVLSFPTRLPVRLTTLQRACRSAVFEANPAACPSASNVGTVTVHTPILVAPLVGPAYLVSYGSTKFPDVVFVLQGEGITLDVDGHSSVSHAGVLTTTMPAIPDAPFSSVEATLPSGSFSVFTNAASTNRASVSQCGEDLMAPVTMVGHNGAEVKESAKLQVTGCRPSISLVRAKVTSGGLSVTVRTSVRGRLIINGPGLRTLVKQGAGSGTHRLTLAFTSLGKRAARAHKAIRLNVGLVVGKQKVSKHKTIVL
jgi:hypothetical protein